MDAHVLRAVTVGLRMRSVDVLTAQEDGSDRLADDQLLDRATGLGRVLFTFDDDLLAEAAKRLQEGRPFGGLIYAHPLKISIGKCVEDLELVAKAGEPEEMKDQVLFLPL